MMVSYLTLLDFICFVFHECSWSTEIYRSLVGDYRVPQKKCAPCKDWKGRLGEAGSTWWSNLFPSRMVLRIVCLASHSFMLYTFTSTAASHLVRVGKEQMLLLKGSKVSFFLPGKGECRLSFDTKHWKSLKDYFLLLMSPWKQSLW